MKAASTSRFSPLFTGRTIRVDTVHGGRATSEWIRLEEVTREGPWSGAAPASEPTTLGDYRAGLYDASTAALLFNCGYSSFFDEWRSTSSAQSGEERSFSESIRMPEPQRDVRLVVEGRGTDGAFLTLLDTVVHPAEIRDTVLDPHVEVLDVSVNGDAEACVNLLFVAEGYAEPERDKFRRDVERLSSLLFQVEPYRSKRSSFNVHGLFAASEQSGISNPRLSLRLDTFLGASFDVFGIARYMLTFENRKLRQAVACVPYDLLVVLCNCDTYGGGGVFNQYACLAADSAHGQYLIAHELGHSFAGLADEYYTSQVTYDVDQKLSSEPWNRNVTLIPDRSQLKWGHLVDSDVPLPTPWEQPRYDDLAARLRIATDAAGRESAEVRALNEEMTGILESNRHFGRVGAFEGAVYRAAGAYRPEIDCLMFSRSHSRFCRVCHAAIEERITELTRRG